jgi:hypothetical protein
MVEIKTLNWRLSSVSPVSTGHEYQLTDRRTGTTIYFDDVRVWDGGLQRVCLKRKNERVKSGTSRGARFDNTEQFPTVILDALKQLDKGGTISELVERVNE